MQVGRKHAVNPLPYDTFTINKFLHKIISELSYVSTDIVKAC